MSTFVKLVVWAALVLAALIPLTCAHAGPEDGQWSLVFYRGTNRGVQCGDDLACVFKNGGTIEDPSVSAAYTRDEFPQPLAACKQEGQILTKNPFSPEARRLLGLNSVAGDRLSLSNKPRGYWDMVLCVKGSKQYIFGIIKKYGAEWMRHVEYRFVE
jgi:hypothetical protein